MKPNFEKLPENFHKYLNLVNEDNVIEALRKSQDKFVARLKSIPEQNGDFRYDRGKWSIKEVVNHVIDVERVFAYRALSFARGDKAQLPGFDDQDWTLAAQSDRRKLSELIEEYNNVRGATISLFESFTNEMLLKEGVANKGTFSVVNLGYIIAGHETHHGTILNDRYMAS